RAAAASSQQRSWAAVAVALAVGVCLIRHNARALVLVFCLLLIHCLRRTSWRIAAFAVLALIIAIPLATRALAASFHVQSSHPEMQLMALDLVGLCVEDEKLRVKFPYTNKNLLLDRYKADY